MFIIRNCTGFSILDISVSSTSDDVILTSSDVAELTTNAADMLFYADVNISSKNGVTDDVITAPICIVATDDFGSVSANAENI